MKNEVLLCDCMEFMTGCKDNEFDLAIVDPPYGIKDKIIYGGENNEKIKQRTELKIWDIKPDKKYFNELFRISKNQIIWGANYFPEYLSHSRGWIVWKKKYISENFNRAAAELAYSSFNVNLKFIELFYEKNRIHACQKPIALYKWLLKNYAKPGQKIFDSHVGSGSSRIAAYDMNFEFIGCEIDKEYWAAQNERFNNYIAQLDLFPKEEIQEKIFNQGVI